MAARSIEEAWRRFKAQRDPKSRAAIIDSYSYLVKITAGRVVSNLPPNLERDDLYTAGAIGLIKAVDQFEYVVVNDELEHAVAQVLSIIDAEALRRTRLTDLQGRVTALANELRDAIR